MKAVGEGIEVPGRKAIEYRKKYQGVIGIQSKVPIKDKSVLSVVYTPGVAEPCIEIYKDPQKSFEYTCRGNTVAIVTDGSRVLGMGRKGPLAALPIMEGKSVIFKTFAGVDAFPICLDTQDDEEIIQTVSLLAPTFGAICIEDISSPRCFTIEDRLERAMNIPVIQNDQHAAAILALAALLNANRIVKKKWDDLSVVINGAGAAGIAIADFLLKSGLRKVVLCDTKGAIYEYRPEKMNWVKWEMARRTNPEGKIGSLPEVIRGVDVFIGVSTGKVLTPEMVSTMAKDPIVFALAVPEPEISPLEAKNGGARVVATSLGDFPNELNVALVFPGIFRGLLDVSATGINNEIKFAAVNALAGLVKEKELYEDYIIPKIFDFQTAPAIAAAVAEAAVKTGVARRKVEGKTIIERTQQYVYEGSFPIPPKSGPYANYQDESLDLHRRYQGVIEIKTKIPVKDHYVLKVLYLPPGAVEPVYAITEDPSKVYDLTCKNNLVAVVSDGSAVLGLGNIGAKAALPVMEGKCILFHTFGGVEAFPICIRTQDQEELIRTIKYIAPSFGGINLEDISAPRCFYVEERLKKELDIPVFHDDQHGTAVVVLAGLANALKVVGKEIGQIKAVVNGAGAAAIAVTKILLSAGAKDVMICDSKGTIYKGRKAGMNWIKEEMAHITNPQGIRGNLADALVGSDVFLGLSVAGALKPEMVSTMAKDPIIFAMANPVPEIYPKEAYQAGAKIVATGRSDFDNQINNCLGFPGIFRGALDVRAKSINEEMKLAAAQALANTVSHNELRWDYIIPKALDFHVPPKVAAAVAKAAMESGVARIQIDPEIIEKRTLDFLYEGRSHLME
jgi:malate dehydrogenase (oxaloacetate-decarboxylating)